MVSKYGTKNKRSCFDILIRSLLVLILPICVSVHAEDTPLKVQSGKLSVSDYQLEYVCAGEGAPNVFLEAPSGISARDAFEQIFFNIAKTNKVCFCERLGFGSSDAAPKGLNQTVKDYVNELDVLIKQHADSEDIVLVGYSFGGFIVRYYAAKHPERIKGILLIDAAHEKWLVDMKKLMSKTDWLKMQGILDWFQEHLGHNYWDSQFEVAGMTLPKEMPVSIISRGLPYERIRLAGVSDEGIAIYNQLHDKYQKEQLRLTSNTSRVIAEKSEHLIVESEPGVVLEALRILLTSD